MPEPATIVTPRIHDLHILRSTPPTPSWMKYQLQAQYFCQADWGERRIRLKEGVREFSAEGSYFAAFFFYFRMCFVEFCCALLLLKIPVFSSGADVVLDQASDGQFHIVALAVSYCCACTGTSSMFGWVSA